MTGRDDFPREPPTEETTSSRAADARDRENPKREGRLESNPESDAELDPESDAELDPHSGPVLEKTIGQLVTGEEEIERIDGAELLDTYGYVRAYFKARPERYRGLQRRLKQARIRDTYDEYLTDSARIAVLTSLSVATVGYALGVTVLMTGATVAPLEGLFGFSGRYLDPIGATPLLLAAVVLPVIGSVLAGAGVWVGRNYIYPRRVVEARRRGINLNLPYAITFMYALSSGGMNFVDVCRRLADADDVYGEAANEFEVVVREMDLFGNDLLRALDNGRALTPSDNLRRFIDDLLGILESGGDLETFLQEEAEEYLEEALEEQEAFIERLGGLSELFVVAFVAAPLFLIVVLMVVSFLGAQTVGLIGLLVYVVFPLGMCGFVLVVHLLSRPYEKPPASPDVDEGRTVPVERIADDPRYPAYRRAKPGTGLRKLLADPVRSIRRRPVLSLWVTLPAGVAVGGLAVGTGVVRPTAGAFVAAPVRTTVWLAVAPLLTATVPLLILHERERRRTRVITERFPDVLSILASANEMGVDLVEGFELVTRWASGTLAVELRKVRNDVAWTHDLTRALLSFADRLNVPQLTRTMTLVAEGSRSSGDLHSLLEIAAADTRARAKLERVRRREVGSYVAIVVVGFLVYLLVIVMVGASYLDPIGELAASTTAPDRPEVLAGIGAIPVETYRMLFLHSALVQGFGSGLIAGKLAENDVLSGLKYGIGLVLVTLVAFVLFV